MSGSTCSEGLPYFLIKQTTFSKGDFRCVPFVVGMLFEQFWHSTCMSFAVFLHRALMEYLLLKPVKGENGTML